MKRIIVLCLIMMMVVATTAYADPNACSVERAKNLYKNGYGSDAIQCLRGIIKKAAANNAAVDPEIYFLMGNWALVAGAGNEAEEYWSKPGVAARYGKEIARLYVNAGMDSVRRSPEYSLYAFRIAARYDSAIIKTAAAQLANASIAIGNKAYFEMAVALDPSLAPKIGGNLRSVAEGMADAVESSGIRGLASTIDPTRAGEDQEWAMRKAQSFLDEALAEARQADLDADGRPYLNGPHEQRRRQLKQAAIAILDNVGLNGKTIAEDRVPEEVVYNPSESYYFFPLKTGEQTDHWMTGPNGRNNRYISAIDSDHPNTIFKILYDDGHVASRGEAGPRRLKARFKFVILKGANAYLLVK